ncbi:MULTISPECIES: GntR family transcriptional regulator [Kocuria]|uniref:GntR family transcriptional regulator n=1 Tax=Kocuria rosea subsp. polaris TaxID=136273 RepID=A0A0W8IKL0_KOCRO|nr:GntR family transcriptional regulator [Kocuria polaris]KUG60786.1 GntR family transcriptional regulator [Kocuria polaris]
MGRDHAWGDDLRPAELSRATLKDSTEALIRRALLSGAMKPGEIYSANGLAARLGVSNSPAREAMMSLANRGLLELVRNRGFRVVELTDRDKQEVYDLRRLIEVEAVRRVAAAGVPAEQAALLRTLTERTVEAAAADGMLEYLEADQRFHAALVDLLGNSRWTAIVENLRDQSRINGSYRLQERGLVRSSAEEHRGITEAVVAGDPELAAQRMIRHLDYARP